MFKKEKQEIEEITKRCKDSLKKIGITPVKFSDVVMQQNANVLSGPSITVSGKILFKFLTEEDNFAMVEFDYSRNLKGSRKQYVNLKLMYKTGVEFSDTINFVDGDNDKFYGTELQASFVLFKYIEDLISPLLRNIQEETIF